MECTRCGKELTKDESYLYKDKIMCEKCYMDIGLQKDLCSSPETNINDSSGGDGKTITK